MRSVILAIARLFVTVYCSIVHFSRAVQYDEVVLAFYEEEEEEDSA